MRKRTVELHPDLVLAIRNETQGGKRKGPRSRQSRAEKMGSDAASKKGVPAEHDDGRPAYWSRCEEMDFKSLRRFIIDCLKGSAGATQGGGRPRSKEQYLSLLNLLRDKAHRINVPSGVKSVPPLPPPPVFPPRKPSKGLASLLEERERVARAFNRSLKDKSLTKRDRAKLKIRRKALDKQIERHRTQYLRPYFDANDARSRKISQMLAKAQRERAERLALRLRMVEGLRNDVKDAFDPKPASFTRRLSWRLLPPGELSVSRIVRHYEALQRQDPKAKYDRDRIVKAFSLNPDQWWLLRWEGG